MTIGRSPKAEDGENQCSAGSSCKDIARRAMRTVNSFMTGEEEPAEVGEGGTARGPIWSSRSMRPVLITS